MSQFKISEQANVIDDNLLNIFGNQFKFDHAKGLAEWIKNSVDAYNRDQRADEDQFIYVRLQPKTAVSPEWRLVNISIIWGVWNRRG
jgi:hypothetical protein